MIRAIANVLSTPIAKETYAQIVDGLPLSHVVWGFSGCPCTDHPLLNEHIELCPGVAEEAQKLCSEFDATTLLMPSKVRALQKNLKPLKHCADSYPSSFTITSLLLQDLPVSMPGLSSLLPEPSTRPLLGSTGWIQAGIKTIPSAAGAPTRKTRASTQPRFPLLCFVTHDMATTINTPEA